MIRIDNISFEFTAPDEKFTHELYADWDGFCRRCYEQVVEECLSTYDKEKVLYEIDQLVALGYDDACGDPPRRSLRFGSG